MFSNYKPNLLPRLNQIVGHVHFRHFFWYCITGIVTNSTGYCLYLIITAYWLEPKQAMTLLYLICSLLSFWGNRKITFQSTTSVWASGLRFGLAQFSGYIINFCLLYYFVDIVGFPHQFVQLFTIFFVAIYLFLIMKVFVFNQKNKPNNQHKL